MLRAYGEDEGDMPPVSPAPAPEADPRRVSCPAVGYKVYRCAENAEQDDWTLIATTSEQSWLDTTSPTGTFRYAVEATYPTGESEPVFSEFVKNSSVDSIEDLGISVGPNPAEDEIRIRGFESIAELAFVDMAGRMVLEVHRPQSIVDVSGFAPGIYLAIITLEDGRQVSCRIIKK